MQLYIWIKKKKKKLMVDGCSDEKRWEVRGFPLQKEKWEKRRHLYQRLTDVNTQFLYNDESSQLPLWTLNKTSNRGWRRSYLSHLVQQEGECTVCNTQDDVKLVKELQEKCKSSSLKKYLEQWLKESKNATNDLIVEESQGAKNKKAKSFSTRDNGKSK